MSDKKITNFDTFRCMDLFQGCHFDRTDYFLVTLGNCILQKGQIFSPESKSFPFRVDIFSIKASSKGSQTGCQKLYPLKKYGDKTF